MLKPAFEANTGMASTFSPSISGGAVVPFRVARTVNPRDPLNHFDYALLDRECYCVVCSDWREKRNRFLAVQHLIADHGKSCICPECRSMRGLQRLYLAALNRRDLYSEMSWHASHDRQDGLRMMDWLIGELFDAKKTEGWWSKRAPYQSLGSWYLKFQYAIMNPVSGMVSGFVGAVSGAFG